MKLKQILNTGMKGLAKGVFIGSLALPGCITPAKDISMPTGTTRSSAPGSEEKLIPNPATENKLGIYATPSLGLTNFVKQKNTDYDSALTTGIEVGIRDSNFGIWGEYSQFDTEDTDKEEFYTSKVKTGNRTFLLGGEKIFRLNKRIELGVGLVAGITDSKSEIEITSPYFPTITETERENEVCIGPRFRMDVEVCRIRNFSLNAGVKATYLHYPDADTSRLTGEGTVTAVWEF